MAEIKRRHRISQRQKRWLLAYLTTARLNATEAARIVGYKWPNHSGPENLQKLRGPIDHAVQNTQLWKEPEGVLEHWIETL